MLRELETMLASLTPYQEKISASETQSILERWEFGRLLIRQRVGRQLPRGTRLKVAEYFKIEATEITRRMQLAETFKSREEVVEACARHGGAWRRIIREELAKNPSRRGQTAWGERAQWRLDKLVQEAGEGDDRHDELVAMLREALHGLENNAAQVAA